MQLTRLLTASLIAALMLGCGDHSDEATQQEMDGSDTEQMSPQDSSTPPQALSQPEYSYSEEDSYDVDQKADAQYGAPAPDTSTHGPNDIVMAITDRDHLVQLVLTPSHVSMKLSSESMGRLRSDVNERGLKEDLKKALLESVQEVAMAELENALNEQRKKTSRHRIRYPLAAVNSMHFQNGRIWIDLQKEKPLSFDDIHTADGRPVLANFYDRDAIEFVDAFDSI